MAKTRFYQLDNPQNFQEVSNQINYILNQISDRLDQIEGIRGTSTVQSRLDIETSDGYIVHGFNTDDEV